MKSYSKVAERLIHRQTETLSAYIKVNWYCDAESFLYISTIGGPKGQLLCRKLRPTIQNGRG